MILKTKNLVLGYGNRTVINSIDIGIRKSEIVTIIGANGSGKSTILKAMSRNLKPFAGMVFLEGKPIFNMKSNQVAKKLVILPQNPKIPTDFTVREIVGFGRFPYQKWTARKNSKDNEAIDWAIEVTGIEKLQKRTMDKLSGGEKQRVWLGMALAQEPEILLLDEPTTYLDISFQFQVLELVRKLNQQFGLTVVMVLHDLNQAIRYSDRIIVLKDGQILEDGPPASIAEEGILEKVFRIKVRVFNDDKNNYPWIIPIKSLTEEQ